MDDAQYDQLVGAIYQAALEPDLWEPLLTRISDVIGATGAQYFVADAACGEVVFTTVSRLSKDGERDYAAHYHTLDPNVPLLTKVPAGQWIVNHHHYDESFVSRSEFYQDFLRHYDSRYLTGSLLASSQGLMSVAGFHRAQAKQGFGAREIHFLERITGHLQRSAQLMHKTLHLQNQAGMGFDALNQLDLALLVCDGGGAIRFANPAAEGVLRQGDGLIDASGQLSTLYGNGQLARLLEEACARSHGGTLAVARPFRRPLHVMITPLAPHSAGLNPWQQPLALVLISDPERQAVVSGHQLAALFRFTPAESRLASALLNGAEPAEYAVENGLSLATVRTQLRALLAKTGTRRQAELVRLLGSVQTLRSCP